VRDARQVDEGRDVVGKRQAAAVEDEAAEVDDLGILGGEEVAAAGEGEDARAGDPRSCALRWRPR